MSLTPLAVATEPASEPSQHNDSISTSDGTNTDATVQATESPSEPIAEDKPNHTVQVNLNAYPSYRAYVQILAQTRYPALKIVLEFLDSDQNDGSEKQPCSKTDRQCILCCYFHLSLVALFADNTHTECCTFERHSGEPSEKLLEGMLQSMTELAQDSQPKKLQRFIIIVQDIKPRGMKLLGHFLNIDPRVFERLLNLKREFTNGLTNVHVLDYCQGYFYRNSYGEKVLRDFQDDLLTDSELNGKLRRWWKDVVSHEQRIVIASLSGTDLIPVPSDVVLFQSLPSSGLLKFKAQTRMGSDLSFQLQSFNSLRHFPSFLHFKDDYRNITTQLRSDTWENMEAIKASIFEEFNNTMVPIHLKGISGAATFITEKWVSLVEQTQEVISETDMPDASNLQLLRIMMKRKHMFAEVKRTLDTLCETIAAPELKAPREHLRKVQNKIESWVADLESTLTLSTSYLSLDETKRAITQSTRTTQLTVLAFVFIPLSTVSSGFGMNVDVLSSSPSIYWFVGIGSGVALATFFYAAYYSRINYMLVSTGFYLLSLVLDVSFLILKIIALPFLWLLLILCSPFTLLLQFLLKDLKNACPGYFLLTLDSIWLVFSWCWNASLSALEWSPSILNIRLAWRAGKKTPRMVRLKEDLGLAPEEPDEGCILM